MDRYQPRRWGQEIPPKRHMLLSNFRTECLCLRTHKYTRSYPEDVCRTSVRNTIYLLLYDCLQHCYQPTRHHVCTLKIKEQCSSEKLVSIFIWFHKVTFKSKQRLPHKDRYERVRLCSDTQRWKHHVQRNTHLPHYTVS